VSLHNLQSRLRRIERKIRLLRQSDRGDSELWVRLQRARQRVGLDRPPSTRSSTPERRSRSIPRALEPSQAAFLRLREDKVPRERTRRCRSLGAATTKWHWSHLRRGHDQTNASAYTLPGGSQPLMLFFSSEVLRRPIPACISPVFYRSHLCASSPTCLWITPAAPAESLKVEQLLHLHTLAKVARCRNCSSCVNHPFSNGFDRRFRPLPPEPPGAIGSSIARR
jgi:hypothetical protein